MLLRTHPLIFCVLVLCLGWSAVGFAQFLSPGDLSASHKALDNDSSCLQCHSSGKRVDDQLCNHCHSDIGDAMRAGRGLHGRQYRGKQCGECHVEHRGRDFLLIRWPGGSRDKFEHELSGWPLRGKHAETKCLACHKRKNEHGVQTFFGLQTACSSCHEDPHKKRFGADCLKCHNERIWKDVRMERFDHALARFPLRGKHASVECSKCHGVPPDMKYRGLGFENCTSCHKDPHGGRFSNNCTSCHAETGWSDLHMERSAHPGVSILGGHADVRCNACHDQGNDRAPTRGKRCVACHAPVHEAPFGNDCAECHKRIQWLGLPNAIGLAAHAKTAFPLRGQHNRVDCEQCHLPKLRPQQRFRELQFERCADCHKDAHGGEFARRDAGECAACHDERGFSPTQFSVEAHADTAFPLIGKHVAVACGGCHASKRAGPRLDWHLAKQQCASCHENPHGDQFAREMQQGGCAHCHNPTGWDMPNIDHSTWPLTGAHALAQCGACHNPTAEDRKAGRGASYRGVPRECEGCHEDAHLGQFRVTQPLRTCGDCHNTAAFTIARFDHKGLTGYPLEGHHERVACAGCHASETLRNGETTVRWRLAYSNCADCHKNPHTEGKR